MKNHRGKERAAYHYLRGCDKDAARIATKRGRLFSVMSDDTARGKLGAQCFKLYIRKRIPQQGDADQECVVWWSSALSISGVFRAQAGNAVAILTGGGASPTSSGTFQHLPCWSLSDNQFCALILFSS